MAFAVLTVVSLLNLWLRRWIGYQSIALVYLLAIVFLALSLNRGPIIVGTALTAVGWRFLFAPPRFSFSIVNSYDEIMFLTYFAVALTIGQLTTRLRAQRDVEVRAKLAAESERLGRTLLNSVSHELRTPIAAITTAANSLRASSPLTKEQQNLTYEIESASGRLNRVVQSLLSAARLQSGQILPKLDWCNVSELTQVVLRHTKRETSGHPIKVQTDSNLPLVRADFVLMEQALTNLIVNAATHTTPGAAIEVGARVANGDLVLEVADKGPGLPNEQLEAVFEPFHRAPSAAQPGGTGLGLAIVKGFIEVQGGRVQATNRAGGGAVFSIY
ncbi:MAG TPA: ATP-binding protein, partial [Verrucomicrobiae bacterium]|nr:ATP-binding protein [Verrucomicrobiae bacterium]